MSSEYNSDVTTRLSREVLFWRLVRIYCHSIVIVALLNIHKWQFLHLLTTIRSNSASERKSSSHSIFTLKSSCSGEKLLQSWGRKCSLNPEQQGFGEVVAHHVESGWYLWRILTSVEPWYFFFIPPSMNGRCKSISRPRLVSSPSWPCKQRKQQLRKHNECCCNHRWHMHSH